MGRGVTSKLTTYLWACNRTAARYLEEQCVLRALINVKARYEMNWRDMLHVNCVGDRSLLPGYPL